MLFYQQRKAQKASGCREICAKQFDQMIAVGRLRMAGCFYTWNWESVTPEKKMNIGCLYSLATQRQKLLVARSVAMWRVWPALLSYRRIAKQKRIRWRIQLSETGCESFKRCVQA